MSAYPQATEKQLQFDVFLGHDGLTAENTWTPLVCEVKNDGPPFLGTIEVSGSGDQSRRAVVELPTGTLKRVMIPCYCPAGGYATWTVRLFDQNGRIRAEQPGLRARHSALLGSVVLGALSRTHAGTPVFRQTSIANSQLQPVSARLLTQLFPDDAFVLEGLTSIYLNSERAIDLKPAQVQALLSWLKQGGDLIVAVESAQDVEGTAWLLDVCPVRTRNIREVATHAELQSWLTSSWDVAEPRRPRMQAPQKKSSVVVPGRFPFISLEPDEVFEAAPLRVAVGELRRGDVLVSAEGVPLIVSAPFGLGTVTMLLFSPEREPVRAWRNLSVLWARLGGVPASYYISSDVNYYGGGWGAENLFGAMLDSRQARKLPLGILLAMLFGYLVVIGPVDYFVLRRMRRTMLTWITFPLYVVGFSVFIYLVGFRLRAGDLEWNQLHIIDLLQSGGRSEVLRGRTYGNVYSPGTRKFQFGGVTAHSLFRTEQSGWYRGAGFADAQVVQHGESFSAKVSVPVWTSELFLSDWLGDVRPGFQISTTPHEDSLQINVTNERPVSLSVVCLSSNRIVQLGDVEPSATRAFTVRADDGTRARAAADANRARIQMALQSRQMAFRGMTASAPLDDWLFLTGLASVQAQEDYNGILAAQRPIDLAPYLEKPGRLAILVATTAEPALTPMNKFSASRGKRMTIWRVILDGQETGH